jgi:hypothetical protein
MALPEEQVLEKLNTVSTAKRLANMVSFVSISQISPLHHPAKSRSTYFRLFHFLLLPPTIMGVIHSAMIILRSLVFGVLSSLGRGIPSLSPFLGY